MFLNNDIFTFHIFLNNWYEITGIPFYFYQFRIYSEYAIIGPITIIVLTIVKTGVIQIQQDETMKPCIYLKNGIIYIGYQFWVGPWYLRPKSFDVSYCIKRVFDSIDSMTVQTYELMIVRVSMICIVLNYDNAFKSYCI